MKPKTLLITVSLLGFFLLGQWMSWRQQSYDYVNNYMFSYTTPKMRRFLAMGHDALVSNLSLIRGIQFYGMNYPLFDKKPLMYDQFRDLADASVQLDPRFTEAYRFWGFSLTSSKRGGPDAYRFLMEGSQVLSSTDEVIPPTPRRPAFKAVQPSLWQIAKDAGYIAQYELKDATPQWAIDAYALALKSPECPEFIERLLTIAKAKLTPDPMVPILEFQTFANRTTNEAIRMLNLNHIRTQVAREHQRFWNFALASYREIHGATPTRIQQLTGDIRAIKAAADKYYDISREWTEDGTAHLFPNLLTPKPGPTDEIKVDVARPPQLPIEPYGGEYLILDVMGEHLLVATGEALNEREEYLAGLEMAVDMYKEGNNGECPPNLAAVSEFTEQKFAEADKFGYPVLFNREECRFYFPPISEDNPPTLPPYNQMPQADEEPTLDLIPLDEAEPVESATGEVEAATEAVEPASP
jgi:hypothetical protein